MEALGLPSLPISCSNFQLRKVSNISKRTHHYCTSLELSALKLSPSCTTHLLHRSTIRMQADGEDYELKQMKDMAAARKRWEALAWVKGSTWIPIFDVDDKFDAGTLSRQITSFVMGGWWSGVPTLSYNNQFLSKVVEKYPKDTDLIVACQKGLRSLAACELLYNAGYKNLFWVQGGLEAAEEEDLIREGPLPFKLAGIGGVSEFLGFTDQQRDAAAKEGWGYRLMFSARLVGVFLVADALFIGAQQVGHYLRDIRSP
ncbi:rhodanese-like domain-containing protein 11, chloroplastic isoform X2 [Quercus suber]|uniref:rhodanese-like domain-containing protein 11, chloroplastic isoform X2 n=1 Tax=Quercus suber TaxID=58331 RepID=UPI0032DF9065